MKLIKSFNKSISFAAFSIAITLFFSSCIKNYRDGETNFSNLQPTVSIVEGGLAQFSSQALLFPGTDAADTAFFRVNYAAVNVAPTNETVTLGVDTAALSNYNASGAGLTYDLLPDSCYSIPSTVTVDAGQSYSAQVPIIVYPDKIDPAVNYMLPISITNAGKTIISGNFGTIYYHFIGNPLAGGYTWDYTRYNGDTTTAQISGSFTGQSVNVGPIDPTDLLLPDSYLTTYVGTNDGITLSFNFDGTTFSGFSTSFGATTAADLQSGGFAVATQPTILEANIAGNASNSYSGSTFRVYYVLINSSGGTRTLVDKFVKK